MNIELKNVKYASFASQETACFEATIYVDGKKAGAAFNEGHGGPTSISPRELEQRIDAYAATLPDVVTDMDDPHDKTKKFTYKQNAENFIDGLLTAYLRERDLKRLLAKRIVFMKANDGGIYETKETQSKATLELLRTSEQHRHRMMAQLKAEVILNALPFEEALKLYSGQMQ